jgi:hypothetical protein
MQGTRIGNLSQANIHDCGQKPPPRRVTINDQGNRVVEKIPALPYRKFVNMQGHVVRVALSNAAAERNTNNPAAHRTLTMISDEGFVPYGKCLLLDEQGQRWAPRDMRQLADPCTYEDFGRGKRYGEHCACPHIEEIILRRQSKHGAAEKLFAERKKTLELRRHEEESLRNKAIIEKIAADTEALAVAKELRVELAAAKAELAEFRGGSPTAPVTDEETAGQDGES